MTSLRLPDGRLLELDVTGPEDGPVLVFHHGTPGCVLQEPLMQRTVHDLGMRLVTWSRPGYAGSTRQAGRRVADVAQDTAAVLDHLGVEHARVAGWSGGGPHALACAALLPDRVLATLVLAGVAPHDAEGLAFLEGMGQDNLDEFGAATTSEEELRAYLDGHRPALAVVTPEQVTAELDSLLPPVDKAVLTGEYAEAVAASFRHAVSQGVDGWLDDDLAFVAPWGFDLASITGPVALWQGTEDLMVPAAHGRWLAERVPGVQAHVVEGEGHLSIGLGRLGTVLADLRATG
ncbi:MAG: hypothetical protein JWR20_1760 [Marmoricola sp.]|nr:hypothetical protein [Marmoricola sp.]